MAFVPEIEPMLPNEQSIAKSDLPDLVLDLERKAAALAAQVCPESTAVIERHMRIINSYYSNLIEGNSTHPRDIRKAMEGKYSSDKKERDLQKESLAHIKVQESLSKQPPNEQNILSKDFLKRLHRSFYTGLPKSLRLIKDNANNRELEVIPGQFRQKNEQVEVGRHIPPEFSELDKFLERFEEAYNPTSLKYPAKLIGVMASHHRLAWIHPFLDGNGRVSRLHTDEFLKIAGLRGVGLWCLSRGLARNNEEYKASLARADMGRQGSSDGRGNLSEKNLTAFCRFMLMTAIDQVEFMEDQFDIKQMSKRITVYVQDREKGLIPGMSKLRPESARLLERAFLHGFIEKKEMASVSGLGLSVTRKLVLQLKNEGLLTETSPRSPLYWAIPDHAEPFYFPNLTPRT